MVEYLLSERKEISGSDGVLAPLLKQFLRAALDADTTQHLRETRWRTTYLVIH